MTPDRRPIGIFDSGIGGLTVLRAVAARLPGEDLLYLGDTARVPYGAKSPATVSRYARECAVFLCERGIKALVVACNTASALAMEDLRAALAPAGVPALGVIEPGAVEACRVSRHGRVGVIGTASTIRSDAYARAIGTIRPDFTVISEPCPLFVPLAEEGWTDDNDPVTLAVATRYLERFARERVDTLILGCTHYPLLRGVIQKVLPGIELVDSGAAVAGDLVRTLTRLKIEGPADDGGRGGIPSLHAQYHVTDDPERFRSVGARFLGHEIDGPHLTELSGEKSGPAATTHGSEPDHRMEERR